MVAPRHRASDIVGQCVAANRTDAHDALQDIIAAWPFLTREAKSQPTKPLLAHDSSGKKSNRQG